MPLGKVGAWLTLKQNSASKKDNDGVQGSRSAESTRLAIWLWTHFQFRATRGLRLLLVIYSALRVFSLGTTCFTPSSKSNTSKFQFDPYSKDKSKYFHLLEKIEGCSLFSRFLTFDYPHHCFGV